MATPDAMEGKFMAAQPTVGWGVGEQSVGALVWG